MKVYLLLLLLINNLTIYSQISIDSLQRVLVTTTPDRNNLDLYLHKMQSLPANETESAHIIGQCLIENAEVDSLTEFRAIANMTLGKIYVAVLNFEDATRFLTNALGIAEQNNFYVIEAEALNHLGAIYDRNELNENAAEHYQRSLEISKKNNYWRGIGLASFNLGSVQLELVSDNMHSRKAAIDLMLKGYRITNEFRDTQNIIIQSSALGYAYTLMKKYDSAEIILTNAEKMIRAAGKESGYIRHYTRVAKLYNDKKHYKKALRYYDMGLQVAKKYNIPRWMCMYYVGLAETYEQMGDYKKANEFNQLNIKMHDALVSRENFIAAADIRNSFERSKKDNELMMLAAVNKQKSTLNNVLIGASLGLLLVSFLAYVNFKNRTKIAKQHQEIQLQRITQLERDKQFVSIDAMLKGQEEERSRIAKDLHDGLGGLLSGTKLSFMNVRESLSLSPEHVQHFDRSLSMLDNTIGDLRKVAQNLMPEALVKFGLREALGDFLDSVQSSTGINVLYQQFGETRKLDNTAEVFIYRIIQELINNVVKHASATQVIVQLTTKAKKIEIAVEDNGKGFDPAILDSARGSGMTNIKYRVQYLHGTTDIVSSPGSGTSVNIELKA